MSAGKSTGLKKGSPVMLGFVYAVCLVFGYSLEKDGSIAYLEAKTWLMILILGILLSAVLTVIMKQLQKSLLQKNQGREEKQPQGPAGECSLQSGENPAGKQIPAGCTAFLYAGIIFLCYLIVFLGVYPGFFVYDAQDELMQVITRSFSTHHPLFHVLLMGGTVQLIHKLTGSYNAGIACYTLLQMAALSLIFGYGIWKLKTEGLRKRGRISLLVYFGVFPTIVMFSLCSAKDGLFTGMVLLMVLMLLAFFRDPAGFFQKKGHCICLFLSSCLMMLLRNNGFYAFLVFVVLLALLFLKAEWRPYRKKMLLLCAGAMIVFLVVNKGFAFVLHADDSENQEILTVPIQQMARVYSMEGDTLTEQQKETLFEILPEETLKHYNPKVSDPVKADFNNGAYEADKGKYRKLWAELFREHPFGYLNAWFMTSYGFWYPGAVIDVYKGNTVFTFTYEDSSYFGYEVEEPGERKSLIPVIDRIYRFLSLDEKAQEIPLLSLVLSPGALFFVWVFGLCFFWYTGQYRKLWPFLFPGLLFLTVLLGPTYLVRYVVFLWVLLPVLLHEMCRKPETEITGK